ncbi:DNA internalization-related competence protein ComEC/Rec2 [Shewanella holmiensis]|uniref:DNA internalization-related competence protein ComEC/Rec2 n=1 Tax=Shewanella holmiensis TaxID=2952222 RepID=UPI0031587EFB
MNRFVFGFCISCLSALLWPVMPPIWCLALILLLAFVCLIKAPLLSGATFAVFWISIYFYSLDFQPSYTLQNKVTFTGEIISLVNGDRDWISLDVRVIEPKLTNINLSQGINGLPRDRIYRLTWQKPPSITVGQVWLFENTRLKPITSVANQGGFNQQRYYIHRHIVAKGQVKQASLVSYEPSIRQKWLSSLSLVTPKLNNGDLLLALLFGEKSQISDVRWQQLRQTGTGHLIAISGLHLSVVFGLVFLGCFSLLTRVRFGQFLLSKIHCQFGLFPLYASLMLATSMAWGYAYLAGYSVSTQRALIMLVLLVLLSLLKQHHSLWQRLMYALAGVLLFDPFANLSAGFWLSFVALGIILRFIDQHQHQHQQQLTQSPITSRANRIQKMLGYCLDLWSIQWRLAIGLGVLQALLFGTLSIHSIWINLLVVPWFSLLVIPVAMLSFVVWSMWYFLSEVFSSTHIVDLASDTWIFALVDILLVPFSALLNQSDDFPSSLIDVSETWIAASLCSLLGFGLLLTFRWSIFNNAFRANQSINGRMRGLSQNGFILCLLTLVMNLPLMQLMFTAVTANDVNHFTGKAPIGFSETTSVTPINDISLHTLDVAQGSAIVLQQQNRALIYDSGAAFGDFSYAERVIIPFLKTRGITQIDYIVISHHDNDHSGGLPALIAEYPHAELIADEGGLLFNQARENTHVKVSSCQPGVRQWGRVTITTLADHLQSNKDNNRSCVMMLAINQNPNINSHNPHNPHKAITKVLLTGDIEAAREQSLLYNQQNINADILFVPHHGSRTSSSSAFIDAVSPQLAIFNAGFNNQYGFPKEDIMARYLDRDIATLVSGEQGQISIKFNSTDYHVSSYRHDMAPFWYNRLFRFGQIVKAE